MRTASIDLERVGEMSVARKGLSPETVAEAVLDLDGARDITMTITPDGASEHLMVAIDGSRAFLGLVRPDGLLQFVVNGGNLEGVHTFSIGGQDAEIENRYLPEIRTAAVAVEEWLRAEGALSGGHWERQ